MASMESSEAAILDPRIVEQTSKIVEGTRWRVDVVRYQPTDRPIEDRWSFHYDKEQKRLILGVYDGMLPLCRTQGT